MTDESPQDLYDFLDDDGLSIPVKSTTHPEGRVYVIPSPDAATGIRLVALNDIAMKAARGIKVEERDVARLNLSDEQEADFNKVVLGTALQEMLDDGVSHVRLQRVAQYAYIYFTQGAVAAENAAKAGLFTGGKVDAPNRAARRAQTSGGQQGQQGSTVTRRRRKR